MKKNHAEENPARMLDKNKLGNETKNSDY